MNKHYSLFKGLLLSADADDPLADLLDDLLPDETRPEPKPRPSKPDKSVSPASASPTLRSQTSEMHAYRGFCFSGIRLTLGEDGMFLSFHQQRRLKKKTRMSCLTRSDLRDIKAIRRKKRLHFGLPRRSNSSVFIFLTPFVPYL